VLFGLSEVKRGFLERRKQKSTRGRREEAGLKAAAAAGRGRSL